MRTLVMRSVAAAALTFAAACLKERLPTAPPASKLRMALHVNLQVSAAGERIVEIRARYRRKNGEQPTLPVQPSQVTVADGVTVQQPVVIDIGPCNADADRDRGEDPAEGCRFSIELTLKNGAGETLGSDEQDVGPVGPTPPTAPTFVLSSPNLTLAPANLAFTARAQQALPAAQPATVSANNAGATLGTLSATIAYTSGQAWLRATVDQASHTLSVQPSTTAMAVGTYAAVVSVTSSVDGMKPQTLPVTYQVSPPLVVTITAGGNGAGSVTSSPAGISCTIRSGAATGTCSAPFAPNAGVTLTAATSSGDTFAGWGGPCTGQGVCALTVTQSVSVSATFNTPSPVLQLSPTSLSFTGIAGSSAPPRQSVSVVNGGGGTLSGISIANVSYGDTETGWLDATVSGTTVSVGATPVNLSTGNHTASVVVGSTNGGTATLSVAITVTGAPPVLRLAPTTLSFTGISRGTGPQPPRQSVTAQNAGGGTLTGINIVRISYGGSESPWLDATVSGTTISIGVTAANLPTGTFTATVVVGSANGGTATLGVTFVVGDLPPRLQLSLTTLTFNGLSGGTSPPRQSVAITNAGGGTLTGVAISSITYPGFPASLWLDATVSGTTISVGANPAKQPVGTATGTVGVTSTNGGTATIAVTFNVTAPPPVLGLTPNTLTFAYLVGGTLPAGQTVRASNIGFGTFADLGPLAVGTSTSTWLRVSFDGDVVVVTPNVAGMPPGLYNGVVSITSPRGGNATITVTMRIFILG